MNHDTKMNHAVSDEELSEVAGGKLSLGDRLNLPKPLYAVGTNVRVLKYDNWPYIVRYARGTVCEAEYKDRTWYYRLTYMDGSRSNYFCEGELGTV